MIVGTTLAALVAALAGAAAPGDAAPAHPPAPEKRLRAAPIDGVPALTVIISVDQFPRRYLERFAPLFGDDGFAAFQRGAVFEASRSPFATTLTGPGHAAIGTGLTPAQHGIVGNAWYERTNDGGLRRVYCVGDPRTELVTSLDGRLAPLPVPGTRASPVHLSGDSLGDRVVERYPGARVVGVALKDRAAILMAGRRAHVAYWYSDEAQRFVSSRYYPGVNPQLLAYRTDCVSWGASFAGCPWQTWSPRHDLGELGARVGAFDTPETERFEKPIEGLDRTGQDSFRIGTLQALLYTPYGNTILLDFARRVVDVERLGRMGAPDVLFVGLSAMDYVGHEFGPDSLEVADAVRRLDRDLAAFVKGVTEAVGAARVAFALTSDHGVQAIPAVARARAAAAHGRADVGEVEPPRIEALATEGARAAVRGAKGSRRIAYFEDPGLWLDWSAVSGEASGWVDAARVRASVRDAVANVPGVSGAWTSDELLAPCRDGSGRGPERLRTCEAVRRSFRADRSPDVVLALRPGWMWKSDAAATHGQPVPDDTDVPLLFWGAGIVSGLRSTAEASPLDVAPTLGALLGVEAGRAGARPLPCLADPGREAAARAGHR